MPARRRLRAPPVGRRGRALHPSRVGLPRGVRGRLPRAASAARAPDAGAAGVAHRGGPELFGQSFGLAPAGPEGYLP
eukprot:4043124-Pyramimonas_sp.AAC.1